jgi:ribulose-bisphosphate carboxylase large chain
MIEPVNKLNLSGDRFDVVYHVKGDRAEVDLIAQDICVEQTIEFPADLISADDDIRNHIIGQVKDIKELASEVWQVTISFAIEVTGFTLPQLINVIFGNISIKPNIRIAKLDNLHQSLLRNFKGPRFGSAGLREIVNEPKRALLCTALKPMGLSNQGLAQQAYEFAKGGMDFIKDDHGLANQPFSPFRQRVELCAEAVERANQETGYKCRYVPSLSSPFETLMDDARFAKECNSGGLLVAPGLVGFDTMRALADNDGLGLPILGHPSFIGSYAISPNDGLSFYALFGQLMRLAGADASIFPSYGGRFSFSKDECRSIADGTQADMGHIKTILPTPGGGMTLDRVTELHDFYGPEMMFLIGGALHRGDHGLIETCNGFREVVENA